MSSGVRDKIFWDPDRRAWQLKAKKHDISVKEYLEKHKLWVKVPIAAVGDEFVKQRNEALINACVVWNAIDKSDKYRIKVTESKDSCPVIMVKDLDVSEDEQSEASGDVGDVESEVAVEQ